MAGQTLRKITNVMYLNLADSALLDRCDNRDNTAKLDRFGCYCIYFKYDFDINSIKSAMLLNEVLNFKIISTHFFKDNYSDFYYIEGGGLFIAGCGLVHFDPVNGVGINFGYDVRKFIRSVPVSHFKHVVMQKFAAELKKYFNSCQRGGVVTFTSIDNNGDEVTVTVTEGEYKALYNYLMGKTSKKSRSEYSEKDYESMIGVVEKDFIVMTSINTCKQKILDILRKRDLVIEELKDEKSGLVRQVCSNTEVTNVEKGKSIDVIEKEYEEKVNDVKRQFNNEILRVSDVVKQLLK